MNINHRPRSAMAKISDHTVALVRLFEARQYAEGALRAGFIVALANADGLPDIAVCATKVRRALKGARVTALDAAESGLLTLVEEVALASAALEPHGSDQAN
jgi:hypothetical protein